MADFTFVSPSAQIKEKDITVVTETLGITTAGLVGETPKGPAFQPVFINSKTAYRKIFGNRNNEKIGNKLKYLLPYYAESYLSVSDQLYVTRVLGLSGYDAGKGWAIKVSSAVDTATTGVSSTSTGNTTFTGSTFSGQTITATTGETFTIPADLVKTSTYGFVGTKVDYIINDLVLVSGDGYSGTTTFTASTITGTSRSDYEDMVVGIVRSRGTYASGNDLTYTSTGLGITTSAGTNNFFGEFILTSSGSTTESYNVSLDPDATNYLSKVLGDKPKGNNAHIFVESIYPDLIKKINNAGYAYGVRAELLKLEDCVSADFKVGYKTPETPWIVSEIRGNKVERLFKFVSISDGDSANKEIKITFQNIDPSTKEFDIVIRDFNDTDDNVIILESFSRCSLLKSSNNFIGKRIGDNDINHQNKSNYVYLEFNDYDNISEDAFPAGFEGYNFRAYGASNTCGNTGQTPEIMYKTSYASSDKIKRTYLGISERAYDLSTSNGKGINQNMFNFYGELASSGITKTKGFHMDSGATDNYMDGTTVIGEFVTGPGKFRIGTDISSSTSPFNDRFSRKFTVVPAGGFDGWDIYRDERTTKNAFKTGGIYELTNSDYTAYLTAIQTFANPEDAEINIFATPGINWSDHEGLVSEALDMVENDRADSIYVIDAPDLTVTSKYAEDLSDLLSTTDFDSSYACTYAPFIKVNDPVNGVDVSIPATGEVLRAMAFTDNVRFPWYAPAGTTRGLVNARKALKKLSLTERDTLYKGRINPIATFSSVGVDIFGQKTLQIKDSALDRINVRRLLLYLRKSISTIAVTLLFDQNDDVIVNDFLGKVKPLLDTVKRERGLVDYNIVYEPLNTPESRERNELYFDLFIKPTPALEFIGINMIVTPLGVSFENV